MLIALFIALFILVIASSIRHKIVHLVKKIYYIMVIRYYIIKWEFNFLLICTKKWKERWMLDRRKQFFIFKLDVENWLYTNVLPKKWCSYHGWHCDKDCDYEKYDEPRRDKIDGSYVR